MAGAGRARSVDAVANERRVGDLLVGRAEVDPALAPTSWLDRGPRAFLFARGDALILACGVATTLDASGRTRFEAVRDAAARLAADDDLRFVGAAAFFDDAPPSPFAPAASASFFVPRWTFVRDGDRAHVVRCRSAADRVSDDALRAEIDALFATSPAVPAGRLVLEPDTARERAYVEAVAAAVRAIDAGHLEKVVLARTAPARFEGPGPKGSAVGRALLQGRDAATRFVVAQHDSLFLGSTPELLVDVAGGRLTTEAIAGTVGRGGSASSLLASEKDRHEHALVVDGIRSHLAPLGVRFDASSAPTTREAGGLIHLATPLGAAAPGLHVLEAVAALHPTPALGGSPRAVASPFIRESEPDPRGFYGGPVGWFSPTTGEGTFVVGIRSALVVGTEARLFAGAGIVTGSVPERELDETSRKLSPMRVLLGGLA